MMLAALAMCCLAPKVVCIDPGHPSDVGLGTRGKRLTEVAVAWEIAKSLRERLTARSVQVVLTKSAEREFVRNLDRSAIANRARADLFVRLHCDAAAGSGFAVYYPSQAGTSHGKTGPSAAVLANSKQAATRFRAAMSRRLRSAHRDNGLKTDLATAVGARQGALTGSIFSEVPVLLVEMCVLTNPRDEAWIGSREGRHLMVDALTEATVAALAE
ncbi:MAG: N-acetylmuramoyl-L-alanine amidase [Fimbriimonadaceae bacterium]|nr:N-acetylmuramoyl-L-alanine amidase [Fimbriimonadaceae bacterium]